MCALFNFLRVINWLSTFLLRRQLTSYPRIQSQLKRQKNQFLCHIFGNCYISVILSLFNSDVCIAAKVWRQWVRWPNRREWTGEHQKAKHGRTSSTAWANTNSEGGMVKKATCKMQKVSHTRFIVISFPALPGRHNKALLRNVVMINIWKCDVQRRGLATRHCKILTSDAKCLQMQR